MMTLAELRAKRNITQISLSGITGISKTSLTLIEKGHVFPRAKNRLKIETALQGQIDWIATRATKPFVSKSLTKESPEESVIQSIYGYIKSPGTLEQHMEFLYEFLNRVETYLKNNK
jgi:transcriptional regulator with XRE-family HTH domain